MHGSIGIHHEQILVECRIDADYILDLMVYFKLQWIHGRIEMDLRHCQRGKDEKRRAAYLVQEMHKKHL